MKRSALGFYAVVLAILLASLPTAFCQNADAGAKLQVHLKYSGTGTVDDKHKIYVALWDSPDFIKSDMVPMATGSTSSKNGVVNFDDVKKTPVYVSVVYDPTGQWDAQSSPPDGSSVGLYSKTGGQPDAVDLKPGKTTKIELAFDDSVKMKGGKGTPQ